MTVHKHAEMIKAKADNMELVVFCKGINDGCEWHEVKRFPNWQDNASYFLCLPQHKEACLHWLNGGEVQTDRGCGDFVDVYPLSDFSGKWCDTFWYMLADYKSRIKPRKEKRWIGRYNHNITSQHFATIEIAKEFINRRSEYKNCAPEGWQFIEIEVEV